MQTYRGAVIWRSFIERQWYATFGYGDTIRATSRKAAKAAVDARRK